MDGMGCKVSRLSKFRSGFPFPAQRGRGQSLDSEPHTRSTKALRIVSCTPLVSKYVFSHWESSDNL